MKSAGKQRDRRPSRRVSAGRARLVGACCSVVSSSSSPQPAKRPRAQATSASTAEERPVSSTSTLGDLPSDRLSRDSAAAYMASADPALLRAVATGELLRFPEATRARRPGAPAGRPRSPRCPPGSRRGSPAPPPRPPRARPARRSPRPRPRARGRRCSDRDPLDLRRVRLFLAREEIVGRGLDPRLGRTYRSRPPGAGTRPSRADRRRRARSRPRRHRRRSRERAARPRARAREPPPSTLRPFRSGCRCRGRRRSTS